MSHFLFKARNFSSSWSLASNSDLGIRVRVRLISSSSDTEKISFTVSYLTDSLGLSPQNALSSSKRVTFANPKKPDKAIRFLKDYGFTPTQISSMVRSNPRVLVSDTEMTLWPKLEFLKSKGISVPEMAKMISLYPVILTVSLEKRLKPSFEFLRDFFISEESIVLAVKRFPNLLTHNAENYMKPNVATLRDRGVSDLNIGIMIKRKPMSFFVSSDRFRADVERVAKMHLDSSKAIFVMAISALRSMSKSRWERKVEAFKKWGFSEKEVLKAFGRNPLCMVISEEKIIAGLDFFINEMGLRQDYIVWCPELLGLSLKKRVRPRCFVYRAMLSRGLVCASKVSLRSMLNCKESVFLSRYITCYKNVAPELLELYTEKMNLSCETENLDDNNNCNALS